MNPPGVTKHQRPAAVPVSRALSRTAAPQAKVLVIGLGGLGAPVAELLAEAASAQLVLADGDIVDRSNLARQWLYDDADIGLPKTAVAARHLRANVRGPWAPGESVSDYEVVVECTDDVDLKFAVSDACARANVRCVSGGVIGLRGYALATTPGRGPCLRCIFEEPTDEMRRTCRDAGVLAPLPAVVGSVMAAKAQRALAGEHEPSLWSVDLVTGSARVSTWPRRPGCSGCAR